MKDIQFFKMVASGNDFILLDNRKNAVRDPKEFARRACALHTGVGADGVLLIEPSKQSDFFLRIINSDGSEAEACGNGYRCVGLYAREILGFQKRMTFDTLAGPIELEVGRSTIKVKMAEPRDDRKDVKLRLGERVLTMDFINTGVPHAVIFSAELDKLPVFELGRAVRFHNEFKPKGTNVNFVEEVSEHELKIRTYERGVEDETLACGTGSVAAALCAGLRGRAKSPVSVRTKSGEDLKVYFEIHKQRASNVFLEGGADFVYEGKLLFK